MNIPIKIAGIGFQVPETVITNDDLTKIIETNGKDYFRENMIKSILYDDYSEDNLDCRCKGEA